MQCKVFLMFETTNLDNYRVIEKYSAKALYIHYIVKKMIAKTCFQMTFELLKNWCQSSKYIKTH